jgi:hypothetical protein
VQLSVNSYPYSTINLSTLTPSVGLHKEDFRTQEGADAVREVVGNKVVPNVGDMPIETLNRSGLFTKLCCYV